MKPEDALATLRGPTTPRASTTTPRPGAGPWREVLYPAAALACAVVVMGAYVHRLTAGGELLVGLGGLFGQMAATVAAEGYALPAHVPAYNGGIPFAYPPLGFYVLAALHDLTGLSWVTLLRFVPPVLVLAYVPAFYLMALLLTRHRPAAWLAAVVAGTAAVMLFPHVQAAGAVRALAYLFLLVALTCGYLAFQRGSWKWTLAAAVAGSLTALSHPFYGVIMAASFLVFAAFHWYRPRTYLQMATLGLLGLALTSAWWAQVISVHGLQPFVNVASAAAGVSGGQGLSLGLLALGNREEPFLPVWQALAVVGVVSCLLRREFLLPVWLVVMALVSHPGWNHAVMTVGALLAGIAFFRVVVPHVARLAPGPYRAYAPMVAGGLLLAYALGSGVVYVYGAAPGEERLLEQVSSQDLRAMSHIQRNAEPQATFAVIDRARGDWLPFLAQRRLLGSVFGTEWLGTIHESTRAAQDLAACGREGVQCLERLFTQMERPDYLYIQTRFHDPETGPLVEAIRRDPRWVVWYEGPGVVVVRVPGDGPGQGLAGADAE